MTQIGLYLYMMLDRRLSPPDYTADLLSARRAVFTRDEAMAALGVTASGGFLKAARRQQRRHALLNSRHGFYVVVPSAISFVGRPPAALVHRRSHAPRGTSLLRRP